MTLCGPRLGLYFLREGWMDSITAPWEGQGSRVSGRPASVITEDEWHSAPSYSNVNKKISHMSDLCEVFHIKCISYH